MRTAPLNPTGLTEQEASATLDDQQQERLRSRPVNMSSQANTDPNTSQDPNSPYRIPQRADQPPGTTDFSIRPIQTMSGPVAHDNSQACNNTGSEHIQGVPGPTARANMDPHTSLDSNSSHRVPQRAIGSSSGGLTDARNRQNQTVPGPVTHGNPHAWNNPTVGQIQAMPEQTPRANITPNALLGATSPYRIPQRTSGPSSEGLTDARIHQNQATPGLMAHNNSETRRNPSSDQTRTELNPMAQTWTGPSTTQNQQVPILAAQSSSQRRGGHVGDTQSQRISSANVHHSALIAANLHNRRNQTLPGSTLRPSSPGYVNPDIVAQMAREMSEPTNYLFSRGLVSPEVAAEQQARDKSEETSGQSHIITGPMSSRNPHAWVNELTERQKLAERERRAAANTAWRQMNAGTISPTSTRVWVNPQNPQNPQNVEHEQRAAPNVSGYHEVPGEPHLHSNVWVNPEYSERDNWAKVQENLKRMNLDRSPFVPHNYGEYLKHRADIAEAAAREQARKVALKTAEKEQPQVPIAPAMMGKKFGDNRGAVTSMETIWTPDWKPTEAHPQAKWPIPAEMKEEGDERHTSGFGRFPALPRVPGNETVGHKMRSLIVPYPLDRVAELQRPALENDVPEPVDEAEQRYLLGGLAEHIEQFGDDPKPEEEEAKSKEKEV